MRSTDREDGTRPVPAPPGRVTVDACLAPLIPAFLAHRRAEITSMRAAIVAGDVAEVRRLAHRMKGVGGTYGFEQVTAVAGDVERAAATGAMAAAVHGLDVLQRYLDEVRIDVDPA